MRIPIGAIIISAFAVVWTIAGTREWRRAPFVGCVLGALLISAAVIALTGRIPPAHPVRFNVTAYIWAVGFEIFFIFVALALLKRAGRKHLLLPIISVIVGLHFFGMVPALGSDIYWWIGGAMILLPVAAMSLLPRKAWAPVTGLGGALILWLSAVSSLFY